MVTQSPEKQLTKKQLSKILQVNVSTIDRWRTQGMPSYKLGVKLVRFDLEAVNEWLQQEQSR